MRVQLAALALGRGVQSVQSVHWTGYSGLHYQNFFSKLLLTEHRNHPSNGRAGRKFTRPDRPTHLATRVPGPPWGQRHPRGGRPPNPPDGAEFSRNTRLPVRGLPRWFSPSLVPSVREKRQSCRPRTALAGAAIASIRFGAATQAHFESRTAQFELHTRDRTCAPSLSACRKHANYRHNLHRQSLHWVPPAHGPRNPLPARQQSPRAAFGQGPPAQQKQPTP
jgi:hypothetical protein